MGNKLITPRKVMTRLGLKKTKTGDYDYLDPNEKNKSKYEPVRKETKY
jgi:hypothetical protein